MTDNKLIICDKFRLVIYYIYVNLHVSALYETIIMVLEKYR